MILQYLYKVKFFILRGIIMKRLERLNLEKRRTGDNAGYIGIMALKKDNKVDDEKDKVYEIKALKSIVKKDWQKYIDEEFVDRLNHLGEDETISRIYRENFLSWIGVINNTQQGGYKYKLEDYISGVKFVSLRLLGNTIEDSYRKVFPDKVKLVEQEYEGENEQQIKERVYWLASAYSKGKLVVGIFQQTLVPSYILNAPLYQEALNTLATMIRGNEIKGMAKVKACEAILEATKQPEVIEQNVNVNVGGGMIRNEAMDELREVTEKLATTLKMEMEKGKHKLQEVADIELVKKAEEGEVANYAVE